MLATSDHFLNAFINERLQMKKKCYECFSLQNIRSNGDTALKKKSISYRTDRYMNVLHFLQFLNSPGVYKYSKTMHAQLIFH